MSSKLRRSARKRKNKPIMVAASDRNKVSQRVPAATSVPAAPQLPTVDTVIIPTTTSAGPGLYTDACSPPATSVSTTDTLLYREPVQNESSTGSSQDSKEHSLGNSLSCSLANGESTLWKASQRMQVNNVKKMLKRSADENSYTFETPLLKASYYGHVNVVRELLERDAVDVNLCDKDKCSPLFWAIHEGHELVVAELLQHSAIVNNGNDIGVTPLWIASQQGRVNIVKQLLQHSADVNICDKDGQLPLHFARKNGHWK